MSHCVIVHKNKVLDKTDIPKLFEQNVGSFLRRIIYGNNEVHSPVLLDKKEGHLRNEASLTTGRECIVSGKSFKEVDNRTMMSYPKDVFSRMFGEVGRIENNLLYPKEEEETYVEEIDDALSSNIFNVMLSRRSQRRFENKPVEDSKIEMLYAAADTAPTAGGFQGFEIYHVKRQDIKLKLVDAANKQPYVNAPVVLIFCMNPERIKLNFPPYILKKFSLQDATLAAAYAQLAAHALGLSSIWIGMIDEEKIMATLNTKYVPSSILCLGYPQKILQPKPKRNLRDLIHEV